MHLRLQVLSLLALAQVSVQVDSLLASADHSLLALPLQAVSHDFLGKCGPAGKPEVVLENPIFL
jgi:hypothetical protein